MLLDFLISSEVVPSSVWHPISSIAFVISLQWLPFTNIPSNTYNIEGKIIKLASTPFNRSFIDYPKTMMKFDCLIKFKHANLLYLV